MQLSVRELKDAQAEQREGSCRLTIESTGGEVDWETAKVRGREARRVKGRSILGQRPGEGRMMGRDEGREGPHVLSLSLGVMSRVGPQQTVCVRPGRPVEKTSLVIERETYITEGNLD